MSALVTVSIHPSQFPDRVRGELVVSLRAREVNHKFLYDSVKQTQKWLALHAAYSPARTDADCAATYDRSFADVARRCEATVVHLVGLGCGGGQKDTRLVRWLSDEGKEVSYIPVDVSTAMVLVARQAALPALPHGRCFPLVCDLATTDDLAEAIEDIQDSSEAARLFTFFGMMPNFEPDVILPRLASLLRPADWLLLSANLAPGPDYDVGIQRIMPLYDNPLTRDWLLTFLFDLGVAPADGELSLSVEEYPANSGLKRLAAYFHFRNPRRLRLEEETFEFAAGESIRLFFSYRHTPERVRTWLERYGLRVLDQWITGSGEEGVFLAQIARD